jgi:hypothetical protein
MDIWRLKGLREILTKGYDLYVRRRKDGVTSCDVKEQKLEGRFAGAKNFTSTDP